MIYPIKLEAPLKDYLWGGTILKEKYGKESNLDKVAESWELSCHKDGNSLIVNGEYEGLTLPQYIEKVGNGVLGKNMSNFPDKDTFPILIKLIDANDNLSVQVHPENEYALRVENEYGKTEMWYVIEALPDAKLIYGLNQTVTKDVFQKSISEGTLLDICNVVNVKKGDVFFIPAGTLHGIGKGIVIAEVQQNSNTTYRVFDYNRVGVDGKPRELHIEKAVDVTNLNKQEITELDGSNTEKTQSYTKQLLSTCEYFTTSSLKLNGVYEGNVDDKTFCSLLCLDTTDSIKFSSAHGDISLKKGETLFLQADYGNYTLDGTGEVLISSI